MAGVPVPGPAPLGFDAMTALKAVCLLSGLAMHVAPLPVMREMEAARSTLNFSVVPYAGPLLNHLVNLWYAVVRRDGPLIVHRLLGIAAQAYYIRTFMRLVAPKREPDARRALLVAAACLGAVALDLHGALPALGLTQDLYYVHLAFFAFVTGVGLAASPLATVGEVLRTRDASSLPAHLCAMVTLQVRTIRRDDAGAALAAPFVDPLSPLPLRRSASRGWCTATCATT